jgi:hypothetical protein
VAERVTEPIASEQAVALAEPVVAAAGDGE